MFYFLTFNSFIFGSVCQSFNDIEFNQILQPWRVIISRSKPVKINFMLEQPQTILWLTDGILMKSKDLELYDIETWIVTKPKSILTVDLESDHMIQVVLVFLFKPEDDRDNSNIIFVYVLSFQDVEVRRCRRSFAHNKVHVFDCNIIGQKVKVLTIPSVKIIEIEVTGLPVGKVILSRNQTTSQSSIKLNCTYYLSQVSRLYNPNAKVYEDITFRPCNSSHGVDGVYNQYRNLIIDGMQTTIVETKYEINPYWAVQFKPAEVAFVRLFNMWGCCQEELTNVSIELLSETNQLLHVCGTLPSMKFVDEVFCDNKKAAKVRVRRMGFGRLFFVEIDVFGRRHSSIISRNKPTTQSSLYEIGDPDFLNSAYAVDGNYSQDLKIGKCSATHYEMGYWMVDLQMDYFVHNVTIYNRIDCCPERIIGAVVELLSANNVTMHVCGQIHLSSSTYIFQCLRSPGRKVRIRHTRKDTLTICEVDVYGTLDAHSD